MYSAIRYGKINEIPTIEINYASKRMDLKNVPTYVRFLDLSGDNMCVKVMNEFYHESNRIILTYLNLG